MEKINTDFNLRELGKTFQDAQTVLWALLNGNKVVYWRAQNYSEADSQAQE